MKKCPYCNSQVEDSDNYCSYCGKKIEEDIFDDSGYVECEYCHSKMRSTDRFCDHCGMERRILGQSDFVNTNRYQEETNYQETDYTFKGTFKRFFKNLLNFKGRTTRRDFWIPYIFISLVSGIIGSILQILIPINYNFVLLNEQYTIDVISQVIALVVELMFIPAAIRRLRDAGKNPWSYLMILIPIVGEIIIFIWEIQPSNRYREV